MARGFLAGEGGHVPSGRLRPICDPELLIDRREVELHSVRRDLKFDRCFPVRVPVRREFQNLPLARRQAAQNSRSLILSGLNGH